MNKAISKLLDRTDKAYNLRRQLTREALPEVIAFKDVLKGLVRALETESQDSNKITRRVDIGFAIASLELLVSSLDSGLFYDKDLRKLSHALKKKAVMDYEDTSFKIKSVYEMHLDEYYDFWRLLIDKETEK